MKKIIDIAGIISVLALFPSSCYLMLFSLQGYYYADTPVTYWLGGNPWIDESTVTFITHLPLKNTYVWDIDEESIYQNNTVDKGEFDIYYPDVGLPEQYHLEEKFGQIKELAWSPNKERFIITTSEEKYLIGVGQVENNRMYIIDADGGKSIKGPTGKDISRYTNQRFLFFEAKTAYFEILCYLALILSITFTLIAKNVSRKKLLIYLFILYLTMGASHMVHGIFYYVL